MGRWLEPGQGCVKKHRQGRVIITRRAVASEFRVRIPTLSFFVIFYQLYKYGIETPWESFNAECGLFYFLFILFFFDPYLPSQARDNFGFWPLSISLDNRFRQSEARDPNRQIWSNLSYITTNRLVLVNYNCIRDFVHSLFDKEHT